MNPIRRRLAARLAFLTACVVATSGLQAQVLDQVPGDALVVLKVRNLGGVSAKFGKFAGDLGLAAMEPRLSDPIGSLQQQLGVQQGLNKDGEMAVAYLDPAGFPDQRAGGKGQSIVILLPITDYKTFMTNFPDAKPAEGGVSEVAMGERREPSFVANWGTYAAISPTKSVVAKKPTAGLKAAGVSAKELDAKDMVVYANFAALRPKLAPEIAKGKAKALTELENNLKDEPKALKFIPVIKAAASQAFALADSFIRDAQGATFSLNFGEEGVSVSLMSEFTQGSEVAKRVTALKSSKESLLSGLPAGKYMFYGGSTASPEVFVKLIDDVFGPVQKELDAVEGPESKAVKSYVDSVKAFVSANTGSTAGLVAPTGALGQAPIIQFVGGYAGDPAKMSEALRNIETHQKELMTAFGLPGDAITTTVTPKSKTVEGVAFDLTSTTIKGDPNDPAAAQQAMAMQWMYGANGAQVLTGTSGKNLLMASGVDDAMVGELVKASQSGAAPLADTTGVKSVSANLPQNRMMVGYIAVDEIVGTALHYASQFGAGVNVQLPPELPPVGVSLSTEGSALRVDEYIPTSLVQSLVAAGMQVMMQMQGGRGGAGGPGGL